MIEVAQLSTYSITTWMSRRRIITILKAILALLLVGWALRQVDARAWAAVRTDGLAWGWIFLAIFMGFLSVSGWALRWYLLLRALGFRFTFREIWKLTMVADFFNLYFLGPMGADGIRYAMLSQRAKGRRSHLIGSLLLDHVIGLQALAILFLAVSLPQWKQLQVLSAGQPWIVWGAAGFILTLGPLSGTVLWPLGRRTLARFCGIRHHGIVGREAKAVLVSLNQRSVELWASCLVSVVAMVLAYSAFVAVAVALRMEVTAREMIGVMPVVDLYAMLPVSVSGVGIREHLFLELFSRGGGLDAARTVSVSLLGFLCLGVSGLIGGLMLARMKRTEGKNQLDERLARTAIDRT